MSDIKVFENELSSLLNKYSLENNSGTPDFLLASFLVQCLKAWEETTISRDAWHSPESK